MSPQTVGNEGNVAKFGNPETYRSAKNEIFEALS